MTKSKEVVRIDPIEEKIHTTYDSLKKACNDLNIPYSYSSYGCLNHKTNTYYGYILKYKDEASPENIKLWSQKCVRGSNGELRCAGCKKWFKKLHTVCHCKDCEHKRHSEYRATQRGFFVNMANSLMMNAKHRMKKGRIKAGVCEANADDLIEIFNNQKGLCAYSGLPMSTKRSSNWKASCERINPDLGYIKSNIILICLEFNVAHRQWSRTKVTMIRTMRNKIVDPEALGEEVSMALNRKNKQLRQFIGNLLQCARKHARRISENPKRSKENAEYSLTSAIILRKILDQKGRCAYSDIPLAFKHHSQYQMSIERLDNKLGYTDENTVLICVEFNSIDNSVNCEHATGSGQWSNAKINFLLENMNV